MIFGLVAGIIIFGFGGEAFFKKTGIPSFLFLVFVGVLFGPVLGVFSSESLLPLVGIFAELTLLMVLFYSGIGMNISELAASGGRAIIQATLYVIPSTVAIGCACHLLFQWDLVQSMIFASMIGGETTAAVVIPLSKALSLDETTTTFIALESLVNSIYSIVLFYTFLNIYQTGTVSVGSALSLVASQFAVGIVLGAVFSLASMFALEYFKEQTYTYVLTLGLLFLIYSVTNAAGGSGILAALIFGIFIGNYKPIHNAMHRDIWKIDNLVKQLTVFQGEVSFLLETFFFVFLGLIFQSNTSQLLPNIATGTFLVATLLAFRMLASFVSTRKSELFGDRYKILLMCAQGLTPATLAVLAVNAGLPLGSTFLTLVTYVIIFTNVVNTAGSIWITRNMRHKLATRNPDDK